MTTGTNETATENDVVDRLQGDRRESEDRRHEASDWAEEERRAPKEERRSWVGRRQAAGWRNQ